MWRRSASRKFLGQRMDLTIDQRVAILDMTAEIAKDPFSVSAIIYPSGEREVDVAGVWVRYRIDEESRTVVFLEISK